VNKGTVVMERELTAPRPVERSGIPAVGFNLGSPNSRFHRLALAKRSCFMGRGEVDTSRTGMTPEVVLYDLAV
jgi:hypothetical protein